MQRVPRVLSALGAVLMLLSACNLVFQVAFPESLTHAIARQDFGPESSAAASQSFNLFSVNAGGFEFVLLFTDSSAESDRPHMVVMDAGLTVLNTFSLGDLDTLAGSFHGSVALRDCNSRVAIGNILFDPSASGLNFSGTQAVDLHQPTLMIATNPLFPWIEANFRANAGKLDYDEYDPTWVTTSTPTDFPIGTPAPAPSSALQIAFASTDPDSLSADVILVLSDDSSRRHYFLPVPKLDVDFHFPSLGSGSLFGVYPGYAVKTNLASSSIGYSRDGMVAYDFESRALEHFTLANPDKAAPLGFGKWVDGTRLACQLSGDSVYVWDPSQRAVTRYSWWW